MLEKLEIKDWLDLNAKLQKKKNNLRKALKEKGILKKCYILYQSETYME